MIVSPRPDTDALKELDRISGQLRDGVAEFARKVRAVERDVYRRNDNSNGDQKA